MKKDIEQLKFEADKAKYLFHHNAMTYDECKVVVGAYVKEANKVARRIAEEYKMRPQLISITSYIR